MTQEHSDRNKIPDLHIQLREIDREIINNAFNAVKPEQEQEGQTHQKERNAIRREIERRIGLRR